MENDKRILNVSFVKAGNGYTTGRLILPILWLRELNITEEDRKVEVIFDGEKIVIQKKAE